MSNLFLQIIFNGVAAGALYAIVALGFALIYNTTRIFHIAHGIIYTIAGYLFYTSYISRNLPLYISILMSLAGAVGIGILVEVLIYRPLHQKKAPPIIHFISSLGIYVLLQNVIALIYGNQTLVLLNAPDNIYRIGGLASGRIQLLGIISLLVIFLAYYTIIVHTKFGKSLKAISSNPLLANVVGINLKQYRIAIFALGSLLAGIGAMLSALDVGIAPNIGFPVVLIAVVSVVIGGIGVFEGAFLGGILIGILQALSVWQLSARWQSTLVFLLLIVFLLFKPEGILGFDRRLEEVKA